MITTNTKTAKKIRSCLEPYQTSLTEFFDGDLIHGFTKFKL